MATIKKVNDIVQLRALIDGKKVVVSEDVIRRDLHLDNADGVECLSNEEIFKALARMGYKKPPPKLTFCKAFFSVQWKFLIYTFIWCLIAKRIAWNKFSYSMASAVICLATGRKFNFSKYIFNSMVRNVDNPSKFLMYPRLLQVLLDNQVDDTSSHNTRYTSHALTQKVFTYMRRVGKGFSGVETPLFASMLVQPQPQAVEEEDKVELQHHSEQSTLPYDSTMPLLTTLMETCASLSQKVAELEQDKHTQAWEILQLKKRVKKLEKKKKLKHLGFNRLRRVGTSQRVESFNDTVMGAQEDAFKQGGINQEDVNADSKEVSDAEPTVFDDEEVTMTMAQTLIKLKAEKAKLLYEHIAQRLHDEEVQKAA
nr:hypothetical protein [Tanacetum cinerariifolium]